MKLIGKKTIENNYFIEGGVCAPKGFIAGGIHAGLKKNKTKKDLAMIACDVPCKAAAVYTTNKVKGAPIYVTQENLKDGMAQALIVNSGNANTCNGDGEEKAKAMCSLAAKALGLSDNDIIVASTGVIGVPLDITPIVQKIDELASKMGPDKSAKAAKAIMTTDTFSKEVAVSFEIQGAQCKIGGICKGSGMIQPNMATMLGFLTTDIAIDGELLKKALNVAVFETFNMVSVDGDTSTNDMVSIMASGLAGNPEVISEGPEYDIFKENLMKICVEMAKLLAKDGEGATKLILCQVTGASSDEQAKVIAKSVINSSLVKTAAFGADANWGRVLCAIGYADTPVDVSKIDVYFESSEGKILVCRQGAGVNFSEELAKKILSKEEIQIIIQLGEGNASKTAYGCDLTYDYVKINGDYRS